MNTLEPLSPLIAAFMAHLFGAHTVRLVVEAMRDVAIEAIHAIRDVVRQGIVTRSG